MTITELVEELADRVGAEHEITWGFVRSFLDLVVERLDEGHEVKIRDLGTFKWLYVPPKKMPGSGTPLTGGYKLRFVPSRKFRSRRKSVSDGGMDKYGVVMDEDKVKTAQEGSGDNIVQVCPVCLSNLDEAGHCPKHGSEPFEPER